MNAEMKSVRDARENILECVDGDLKCVIEDGEYQRDIPAFIRA